jgi:hypothetical protein
MNELVETSASAIRKKIFHPISGLQYRTELFAKIGDISMIFEKDVDKLGVLIPGSVGTLSVYVEGKQTVLKEGNGSDVMLGGLAVIDDILNWAFTTSDLLGVVASSGGAGPSATEATLVLVKNAISAMDLTDASEATQNDVKLLLTSMNASKLSEATGVLIKNLLTGIQTSTAAASTEATLLLVKTLMTNQLAKLTDIVDNNIPVSIVEMLDRRTFLRVIGQQQPGNCSVDITQLLVDGINEGIDSVDWGYDSDNDNLPDVNASLTFNFGEYGTYPVFVKTISGLTFRFIIVFQPNGIPGKIDYDFTVYHTADGRTNLKRYYKLLQKTAAGVVDLGAFDELGVAYSPVNTDDGTLKLIEDANLKMAFDYPQVFDVTGAFVLKAFKYHEIVVQPAVGSSCTVQYDGDDPVALEALEVHRVVATTKVNRAALVNNVVGTVRISTLR